MGNFIFIGIIILGLALFVLFTLPMKDEQKDD